MSEGENIIFKKHSRGKPWLPILNILTKSLTPILITLNLLSSILLLSPQIKAQETNQPQISSQSTNPTQPPSTGTIPDWKIECPIPNYGFISGSRETNLVPSTFPRCPITKGSEITYNQSTERLADIETRLISPKNTLVEIDSFIDPNTNKPRKEKSCTSHGILKQQILSEFLKQYPEGNSWQEWYEYLNNYQSENSNLIIPQQTIEMDRLSVTFEIDPEKLDCDLISGLDKTTKLSKLDQNSYEGSIDTTLPLGLSLNQSDLQPDQDRFETCTTISQSPIKNRRIGTCSDGIYTIESRVADSAGNATDWKVEKIERDTVRPYIAPFTVSKNGSINAEFLGLQISDGEGYVRAKINITSDSGYNQNRDISLDANGNYSTTNLIDKLKCGQVTYSIKIKYIDRAGNESEFSQIKTITTDECARCGYTGGDFATPIRDDGKGNPVQWTISQNFAQHGDAIDMVTVGVPNFGHGTPIYPIAPGKVLVAKYQGGIPKQYGKDNHVLIDHGNGLRAWYVHFMNETNEALQSLPKVGDFVNTDTVIGHLGNTGLYYTNNTGQYAGTHLHLQVLLNGKAIDPSESFGSGPTVECIGDDLGFDLYKGRTPVQLGNVELRFVKKKGFLREYMEFVGSNIPAPVLTTVMQEDQDVYRIYGVAIQKGQKVKAIIYEEKCGYLIFSNVCEDEYVQTIETKVEHTEVKAYKSTWLGNREIHQLWDGGRFDFSKKIPGDANANEDIFTQTFIYGSFDCLGFKCDYGSKHNKSSISNKMNPVRDAGQGLERPFKVSEYETEKTGKIVIHHNGGRALNKFVYDIERRPKVWLISHGMKNTHDDMNVVAEAIKSQHPNDVILKLDWEGARNGIRPNDTDQWIHPTAEMVAFKLKTWGFDNANDLRMAGHSMGTIMINEIAIELQQSQGIGNTYAMHYLDPPSFFPGISSYKVRDDSNSQRFIYNKDSGYSQKYNGATISRAYTGIRRNGYDNNCGNVDLNRTAKENISLYFPDFSEQLAPLPGVDCGIHGYVNQAFARLVTDQKITFDGSQKLNLFGKGMNGYLRTKFYKVDDNFQSSLYVKGTNDIQNLMTYDGFTFNLWGKEGGALYANFNHDMTNVKERKKLIIRTFGDSDEGRDRISLESEVNHSWPLSGRSISTYRVEGKKIFRTVYTSVDGSTFVSVPEYEEYEIKGGRSDNFANNSNALDPSQNFVIFRK